MGFGNHHLFHLCKPSPPALQILWLSGPTTHHRIQVEISHQQVLFKGFGPKDNFPPLIQQETIAIEHQLILTTHHVGITQNHFVLSRSRGQHLFTKTAFTHVEGRSIDIHNQLRTSKQSLMTGGTLRIPNVFTNVDTHHNPIDHKNWNDFARAKVSALIKHPIIGEDHF